MYPTPVHHMASQARGNSAHMPLLSREACGVVLSQYVISPTPSIPFPPPTVLDPLWRKSLALPRKSCGKRTLLDQACPAAQQAAVCASWDLLGEKVLPTITPEVRVWFLKLFCQVLNHFTYLTFCCEGPDGIKLATKVGQSSRFTLARYKS